VAVADVYAHRRLGELADRLDCLGTKAHGIARTPAASWRRWSALQLAGVFLLLVLSCPPWLIGILAIDRLAGTPLGPQVAWGWLIAAWLVLGTTPGRATIVLLGRRLLDPSCSGTRSSPRWRCGSRAVSCDRASTPTGE